MPPLAARAGDLAFIRSGELSPVVACRDVSGDCPLSWLAATCLGTVPGLGVHQAACERRRYAFVFVRLPQICIEHQVAERFFE